MDVIGYLIFWLKLFVLSLPFMFAGAIATPLVPKFGVGISLVINVSALVLGFIIMVICFDEDELSKKYKKLLLLGKVVFLFACIFAIACLFTLGPNSSAITRIMWIPLTIIASKIFFGTKISETF